MGDAVGWGFVYKGSPSILWFVSVGYFRGFGLYYSSLAELYGDTRLLVFQTSYIPKVSCTHIVYTLAPKVPE